MVLSFVSFEGKMLLSIDVILVEQIKKISYILFRRLYPCFKKCPSIARSEF